MGNIDLIIILTTAFLGSVGHCIGMCGGIVVAYSSTKIDQQTSYLQQTSAHLAYNFGRVTTYAAQAFVDTLRKLETEVLHPMGIGELMAKMLAQRKEEQKSKNGTNF